LESVPRDVASRAAKERSDAGFGVNKTGEAVYLDFAAAKEDIKSWMLMMKSLSLN
jgi:succinate dehydrogenase / fumarate reductase flavoprotein subunit